MDARTQEFLDYVQSGGQVETGDWMPDEYRARLVKFIEMHGNSELMGVLPERDWILRAPTLQRKLALTAKIQDEVGHAQLIYRVVEDLGKPRSACLDDLVSGKAKFHNVFHYPTRTWGDVGVIAWLVDAAAIVSQKALLKCSYAPYARIMKKICWEESFHILHGRDVILALVTGTDGAVRARPGGARPLVGAAHALPRQPDPAPTRIPCTSGGSRAKETRTRASSSSTATSRRSASSGSTIPDPALRKDDANGHVALHGARLGEAPRGRDGPRAGVGRAAGVPAAVARGRGVGRAGRARGGRVSHVYEVFRQERKGQPFQHAGSVVAPDEAFAEIYAREQYGRRQESVALWLVPREALHEIDEFPDEFEMKYRRVDGYSIKARLAEARERAGTLDMAPGATSE